MVNKIEVYCDGSATTGDNEGGWGVVVLFDNTVRSELSGHLERATNNDAELVAAIKGLDFVLDYLLKCQGSFPLEPPEVILISDSQIVLNWANGIYRFKQIEKLALYDELRRLVKKLNAKTQWVRSHSGNIHNERCDKLANNARKNTPNNLDKIGMTSDTKIGRKKDHVVNIWYGGQLKIIDFESGIIEDYDKSIHGKRGSVIEIRKVKER